MASFAEALEAQRGNAADRLNYINWEGSRLHGEETAEGAFRRAQLMDLLDEVVGVATSRDKHEDARWYFFMEPWSQGESQVDTSTNTWHMTFSPIERPVALMQWSEAGFRLTLEVPNFNLLRVGIGSHDGVFVPLGDEHIHEVVAARYDRPEALHFPYPAILDQVNPRA